MRSVADETRGKVNPGYHTEDVTSNSTKIHLRTEHPAKWCVMQKYIGDYFYLMEYIFTEMKQESKFSWYQIYNTNQKVSCFCKKKTKKLCHR